MPIELATKYLPYTDEIFTTEAKLSNVTNQDFSWDGAATIKVYHVTTGGMNDYGRGGPTGTNWSRYGKIESLDATTQAMTLRKDRSFTFAIDRLDTDETEGQLAAASALARQLREVVVPEVDAWTFLQMCENAGQIAAPVELTPDNIYLEIIKGTNAMDNAEVPDAGRVLVVVPDIWLLLKQNKDVLMSMSVTDETRRRGVVAMLDGMNIVRVPANRLPEDFGFMIAHSVATVAPTKLESFKVHQDPPGISGSLVEGRINYDAFVLDNKAPAIYYQATAAPTIPPVDP